MAINEFNTSLVKPTSFSGVRAILPVQSSSAAGRFPKNNDPDTPSERKPLASVTYSLLTESHAGAGRKDAAYMQKALGYLLSFKRRYSGKIGEMIDLYSKSVDALREGKSAIDIQPLLQSFKGTRHAISSILGDEFHRLEDSGLGARDAEMNVIVGLQDILNNGAPADLTHYFNLEPAACQAFLPLFERELAGLRDVQLKLESLQSKSEDISFFLASERKAAKAGQPISIDRRV